MIGPPIPFFVTSPPEERSPLTVAMEWSSRLTTIALEMVLPGLLGYWVDQKLGTGILLLVLGVAVGFAAGLWSLIKLTRKK